ncbi:MAG TPA: fumarylacetoacetate hydrolase family protein [Caulobacteraceae bacterium]|nr:fumarylacetoacetate hydrolase family protein [Caulobacteraceae bacterium]
MKFVSYSIRGRTSFGLVCGDRVVDLKDRSGAASLKALIDDGGLERASAWAGETPDENLADIVFEPVIGDPGKIICIGLNYADHVAETGRTATGEPTVFLRFADTQIGHGAPIPAPKPSGNVDYEGELAVIIGKGGRYIPESEALGCIAGFACYNDVSIRDFQRHTSQFTAGKNFPGTGPFGPFLVTPDEVGALGPQRIRTRLNGQVVQDAHLSQMIFPAPRLIAYISKWTKLSPGDVIVTGTPGGVGAARQPPLWMKPGDVVEVEIDKVGLLKNPVAAEAS